MREPTPSTPAHLTDAGIYELEQIQGILLEQAKEITRRIGRGTMTEISRRELMQSLDHARERISMIATRNNPRVLK